MWDFPQDAAEGREDAMTLASSTSLLCREAAGVTLTYYITRNRPVYGPSPAAAMIQPPNVTFFGNPVPINYDLFGGFRVGQHARHQSLTSHGGA